jgi:predicted Na+-dependent transporter
MLVLAISSGSPLLPKTLTKFGRHSYVLSLAVTSSLFAILFVPAWLEILGALIGRDVGLQPRSVAIVIAKAFLVPLLAGMLVRRRFPSLATRFSDWLLNSAGLVLSLSGLALLVLQRRVLASVGLVPLLALAAMAVVALAIGHVLGGPDADERTALAVSCSSRHIGVAVLAASTVPGPRTMEMVLAYLVASAVVTKAYLKWRDRAARVPTG